MRSVGGGGEGGVCDQLVMVERWSVRSAGEDGV